VSYDYDEPDGTCVECGEPTEEEHHRYCMDCYREQQGWAPRARLAASAPPASFVEGLANVRQRMLELEHRLDELGGRLDTAALVVGRLIARVDALERTLELEQQYDTAIKGAR
jgi:hypothetical protein